MSCHRSPTRHLPIVRRMGRRGATKWHTIGHSPLAGQFQGLSWRHHCTLAAGLVALWPWKGHPVSRRPASSRRLPQGLAGLAARDASALRQRSAKKNSCRRSLRGEQRRPTTTTTPLAKSDCSSRLPSLTGSLWAGDGGGPGQWAGLEIVALNVNGVVCFFLCFPFLRFFLGSFFFRGFPLSPLLFFFSFYRFLGFFPLVFFVFLVSLGFLTLFISSPNFCRAPEALAVCAPPARPCLTATGRIDFDHFVSHHVCKPAF